MTPTPTILVTFRKGRPVAVVPPDPLRGAVGRRRGPNLQIGVSREFGVHPGKSYKGYWCHFGGGSVAGWAHVVSQHDLSDATGRVGALTILSSAGPAARLEDSDQRLSVETHQLRIDGFRKLAPTEESRPSMRAMATLGNFLVVGCVVQVTRGDDGQVLVLDIDADGWAFAVSVEDVGADILGTIGRGDGVQFQAIGLSLWDEGY